MDTVFSQEELANRSIGPSFLTKTGVRTGATIEDPTIFSNRPVREYDTSLSDSLMRIAMEVKAKRDERIAAENKAKEQSESVVDRRAYESQIMFVLVDALLTQCAAILHAAGETANVHHGQTSSSILNKLALVTLSRPASVGVIIRFMFDDEELARKEIFWEPSPDGYGSYDDTIAELRRLSVVYTEETIRYLIDPSAA